MPEKKRDTFLKRSINKERKKKIKTKTISKQTNKRANKTKQEGIFVSKQKTE